MTTHGAPDPGPLEQRDARVRRVTRMTRGVAAAAVLGTVVFGGLAAAHSPGDRTRTASTAAAASASATTSESTAQAPSASTQAPVASSGGS